MALTECGRRREATTPGRPAAGARAPELAAGPHVLTWCSAEDRLALELVAGNYPERSAVVYRAQHAAWWAFQQARDEWLAENGYTLRELRAEGLLLFRPPYFE